MNQFYAQQYAQQWVNAGVPQEKVAALLKRASEISQRSEITKNASVNLLDRLVYGANMQKTASSVAYTQGLFKEAVDNGATLAQAYAFTKQALDATNVKLNYMQKVSAITSNPDLASYAEGFIGTAKQAGMTDDAAINLLLEVVDNQKQANDQMFKQSPAGAPGADGGVESPAGGPGAPGGHLQDEEAQLLQVLQSLPPEQQEQIVQQILQAISGGQGGPGGQQDPTAGAGGPPPSGAGGPPPGGPQGPV